MRLYHFNPKTNFIESLFNIIYGFGLKRNAHNENFTFLWYQRLLHNENFAFLWYQRL